jgi:hypothetical protein
MIAHRTNRVLPYEALIQAAFAQRADLQLPYSLVSKLISWLLPRDSVNEGQSSLVKSICEREPQKVRRFASRQSDSRRQQLLPFLQPFFAELIPAKKRTPAPVVTGDSAQLLAVVREEMNSRKSNFPKLLAALAAYQDTLPLEFRIQILEFIGKLRETVITESREEFGQMCLDVFDSPEILRFLGEHWIGPERLMGLGRVVWSSPASLLEGSEQWLSVLYGAFLASVGAVRREIVKIFLAIEEATKVCVTDITDVKEPYRSLIVRMMGEYSVEG